MKILLLSRYDSLGASTRLRSLQYLPYLRSHDIDVTVSPLFSNRYVKGIYQKKNNFYDVLLGYIRRFLILCRLNAFDLVIIEKELFPFLPAVFERLLRLCNISYLVDYDDALFHRYNCHSSALVRGLLGKKIDVVMRNAAVVIAGNKYIAGWARQAGARNIEIIPTVVDMDRYQPGCEKRNDVPVIGWIGTPLTSRYLKPLLPVFESLCKKTAVRIVAVGANSEDFQGTLIDAVPWSEHTEIKSIQEFDIGIMPLPDSPWERGKCGYKLIQYMACGLPVVASPVGANNDIVCQAKNGFLAQNEFEWELYLEKLIMDVKLRSTLGRQGRLDVEDYYSLQVQARRLFSIIKKAAVK